MSEKSKKKPSRLVLAGLCTAWAFTGCGGDDGGGGEPLDPSWQSLSANSAQVKYFSVPARQSPAQAGTVFSLDAELDVAMASGGQLAVSWATGVRDPLDRNNPDPPAPEIHRSDVHLQMVDAQGNLAGSAQTVGSIKPGVALNLAPRVAINAQGEAWIAWWQHKYNDEQIEHYEEATARSWLVGRRYSPSGSPLGGENVIVQRNNIGLGRFDNFTAIDGTVQLGFSFGSRLHETEQPMRQLFDSSGNALGAATPSTLQGMWPDALGPNGAYAAISDLDRGDGNPANYKNTLTWFSPQGVAGAQTVISNEYITSVVYGQDGTLYVATARPTVDWSSIEGFVHRYDSSGTHLGQTSMGPMLSDNSRTHSGIALAQGQDGRLVAAWQNNRQATPGIRAQMLSEQGEKLGDEMRVDELHPEYQYFTAAGALKPRVVMGANGRFVVVYVIFHQNNEMLIGGSIVQP